MRRTIHVLAVLMLASGLISCQGEGPHATGLADPEYVAEIDAWSADREARLRSDTGWLTLVGLHWLSEGDQSFGSDPGNDIVFPEGTPPQAGVFRLADGEVSLKVEEGVDVRSGGEPVQELVLATDATAQATELEMGSLLFYTIARGDRLGIRVKDRESPKLASFEGIERFPVDEAWRLTARFERFDEPKVIRVPNVVGTVFDEQCEGAVVFDVEGVSYRIEAISEVSGELFLIFGDATNGDETYGGGRFLYTDAPAEDGTVVVDFNKTYIPPCAFTPFATCPLPPAQNNLPIPIEAGEKTYGAHG